MKLREKFIIIQWPESQFFMDYRSRIHLADSDNAYEEFGDSAYFISLSRVEKEQIRTSSEIYIILSATEMMQILPLARGSSRVSTIIRFPSL